jgi:hypothetical protein
MQLHVFYSKGYHRYGVWFNSIDGDTYDVDPGLCVIVNNVEFAQLSSLSIGKKDEKRLAVLFSDLGFSVKIHRNLTGKGISDTAKSY